MVLHHSCLTCHVHIQPENILVFYAKIVYLLHSWLVAELLLCYLSVASLH